VREIIVTVPQGVGDGYWAYQKLSPHFDRIHFRTACTAVDAVQTRAGVWLALLPRCGSVAPRSMSAAAYDALVRAHTPLAGLLAAYASGRREFDYAVNRRLEEGVRLEDIDPGYAVETAPELPAHYAPLAFAPGAYLCLYVSGDTERPATFERQVVWPVGHWARLVVLLAGRYARARAPVVLVGAAYDRETLARLAGLLGGLGIPTAVYVDSYPANVVYIIKHARAFVGYQSGLGVVADWVGTPQLMVYFPALERLRYSWCRPGTAGACYHAGLFSTSPEEVVAGLPADWL
jgi:hypothetical protein